MRVQIPPHPHCFGATPLPALIGVAFAVFVIGAVYLVNNSLNKATPTGAGVVQESSAVVSGTVASGESRTHQVSIKKGERVRLTLVSSAPNLSLSLSGPAGAGSPFIDASEEVCAAGSCSRRYEVSGATAGAWELGVHNGAEVNASYQLTLAGAPVVSAQSTTGALFGAQQNVILSLLLGENGGSGSTPLSNATVVATIIAPSQAQSSVTLTESASSTGSYSGSYSGTISEGTYIVQYVITGVTESGEVFQQTVYDQFIVTSSTTPGTIIVTKKYDINRSGQITIIGD